MSKSGGRIPLLPAKTITVAISSVAEPAVTDGGYAELEAPTSATFVAVFAYGSAGTTAKAYVQTSLDNGATWFDIASFSFTTASATKISSVTTAIAPATQAAAPTLGTLANDTINQGVLGNMFRAMLLTTGTYAGGTTLAIHMFARR